MFEVLVEMRPDEFITFDVRHTKAEAEGIARKLHLKKKNTRIIDRDYKKPPKEDWRDRRGGRRDRDDEE
jgi:hypothetical protein